MQKKIRVISVGPTQTHIMLVVIALFKGTLTSDFFMNTVTRRGSLKQIQ
jgi:uncharacterized membrane protein YwzB